MSRDQEHMPLLMSFQVVEVHKPLPAVSRLTAAGHKVYFDDVDPHIMLSTGQKLSMVCNGGTYDVEVWIEHPANPASSPVLPGRAGKVKEAHKSTSD